MKNLFYTKFLFVLSCLMQEVLANTPQTNVDPQITSLPPGAILIDEIRSADGTRVELQFEGQGDVEVHSRKPIQLTGGADYFKRTLNDYTITFEENGIHTLIIQRRLPDNQFPIADDKIYYVSPGQTINITLTGSDPDAQTLSYSIIEPPYDGKLSGEPPLLQFTASEYAEYVEEMEFEVSDNVDHSLGFITLYYDPTLAPTPGPVPNTPAPVTPAPITAAPVTPAPATPAPITPTPVTSAPITPAPVTPAPVTPAPVTPAPVTPAPVTSAPTTAPVTPKPVTPAPITPTPVTPAPVTSAPVTSAPITPKPVTSAPVTRAPVTQAPVTPAPVTSAPVTSAPVTPKPVTSAPITPAPITPAPVTPAPVTQAPVTPAPVTPKPVTSAPITSTPVTQAPVTPAPVTSAPVTSAPVTPAPVTSRPTIPEPDTPPSSADAKKKTPPPTRYVSVTGAPVYAPQPPAPIVIDGKFHDWRLIDDRYKLRETEESARKKKTAKNLLENEVAPNSIDILNIYLYNDDDNLYVLYKNRELIKELNKGWVLGLDVDRDASTGYSWYGCGADFILQADQIFQHNPNGNQKIWDEAWTYRGSVTNKFHRRNIEFSVPFHLIDIDIIRGGDKNNGINIVFEGDHSAYGETGEKEVVPEGGNHGTYPLRKGGSSIH